MIDKVVTDACCQQTYWPQTGGAIGLEPGKDVEVDTSIQFNMMAGAFSGGSGDYVTLFEPTATEIEGEGKGFVLASVGEESGEIPYTTFFSMQNYRR